jgi:hypothetical protein
VVRIGSNAFRCCGQLKLLNFPASLEVIGKNAFEGCRSLRHLTFSAGSQLQCIHSGAFEGDTLETVILPATVKEINPSAFESRVWPRVEFDGPPPLLITTDFICSPDSRIFLGTLSLDSEVRIPSHIEVIGSWALGHFSRVADIVFESGTRLKEIGENAFAGCNSLKAFHVPSSVETIGDRSFENCINMTVITFKESSSLKRIGERAFSGSPLRSITIPALTEEIDGSAFVGCPTLTIQLAPGNRNFTIEGNLLVTSDGTEIVKYIGRELEVQVPAKVEILKK